MKTVRKPILATRVSPYINQSVRRLTKGLGISISEYLRKLILQDLDSRKMFEDELKKAVEQSDEESKSRKPRSPKEILWNLFQTDEDDNDFFRR